jgi:hypothetical protein
MTAYYSSFRTKKTLTIFLVDLKKKAKLDLIITRLVPIENRAIEHNQMESVIAVERLEHNSKSYCT